MVIANGFVGMPLITEESPDYYVKGAAEILGTLTSLKDKLMSANRAFSAINNLLGTTFISNTNNQQIITDLLALIQNNIILQQNWFATDIGEIKALVNEAKTTADQLKIKKEKILGEWESDVLSLDYSPILLRYKTDYTSIFKVFNSQYRQDKKQIQALSKKILKKLPDEVAVDLLNSLKTYHEKKAWFDDKSEELSRALSTYYTGIDSDWDFVLAAIGIAEKLLQLPVKSISACLIELLSVDHKAQIESLESLLSTVMTSFAQARDIVTNSQLSINLDSADFDSDSAVTEINAYIAKISELSEHKNLLISYLHMFDENIGLWVVAPALSLPAFYLIGMWLNGKWQASQENKRIEYNKSIDKQISEKNAEIRKLEQSIKTKTTVMHFVKMLEFCGEDISQIENDPNVSNISRISAKIQIKQNDVVLLQKSKKK